MLPDKVYNILKWICLICLPALSTFYGILAEIWNLPYAEQIPKTINAVALVLGILIGISQISINVANKKLENNSEDASV